MRKLLFLFVALFATSALFSQSRISVTDGTLSDWDQLPQEYVSTCICPEGASYVGLLSMKAYADERYINLAVEYNPEVVTDLSWPAFHVCIDTDNSASTGGYGDQWTIGAFDVLLETAVFVDGQPYPYNPGVYWWWGAVGENGWAWTNPNVEPTPENCWGLIVCEGSLPVGNSQLVGNTFEIQLNRELIPTSPEAPWSDVINIGVDIQQNWSSVGILPIATANETDWGKADPLTVQIDEGPGRITYELNGGVTNEYRWQNKNDMFQSFMKSAGVSFPFSSLDDLKLQGADAFTTICAKLLNEHVNNIMSQKKWEWLWEYIMVIQNADANATHLERGVPSAGWRYAIAAFFLESQRTGWPKSADFSTAGTYDAFKLAWKQGFKNPKNPTEEYVLNAPYREGYVFEGWYANEDLSREVVTTVDSETSGTLYAKWGTVPMATLTLTTNQPEMGEVSGPSEGVVNGLVTFRANAYNGYEFIRWVEDGNTDNPRSIFLTKDTTFTAEFAERKVHISTNIDMWEWGTTQGDTAVAAGETVTLTAIPNEGYQFTHWYTYDMYGNYQEYYENPLVIQADRFDQVFTAAFLAPQYALSVNYDPAQCDVYWHNNMYGWGGYFSYSGEQIWVDANSEIMLSVEPFDGCTFEKWNDDNIDNPRYITLSSDTTFTAEFAARQVTISTGSNEWGWGTTKGDTMCFSGDSITLIATPYPGYYLAYWETFDIYGNYQQYYGDTISILAASYDQYFTAWFEPIQYALTTYYDSEKCKIYWYNYSTGEGNNLNSSGEPIWSWANSSIELWVEPLDGYTFAGWSDGNYENPRYFTMEAHDTIVPSPMLLGVCGYNLYWDYTYGMLDITGDGDMYDYTTWTLPWQQYAHQIYSISLPEGMTSVGASAFADCRFLESVTIPATVREIRYSAFENNRMLSTVNFAAESALTTIGNWAFYNCHELNNITIPEGVTEIGYAAFYGCTYMSELSLPESMQYIADNGFALCSKLRRMNVAASTPPTVAARTFEDVDRAIPVYVPTESVGLYKAAPVWKEFNIVGRDNAPTSVENTEVNSSNVQKIFRDGQVLILRDGKTYSVMGQEM